MNKHLREGGKMNIKKNNSVLSTADNALRILRSFSIEEPEKKVTDIAVSLGLSNSSVSRLMTTLAGQGFVKKSSETQMYKLGLSALALTGVITSNLEIYKEALPVLRKLVSDIGETCHLSLLEGHEIICLQKIECKHPIKLKSYMGNKNPIQCTSSGKAIFAYQKEDIVNKAINDGLERFTSKTITNPDEFRECLREVRERGYSYCIGEFMEEVVSVGAPIRDYTGKVIAAVTITGPIQRIDPEEFPVYAKKLKLVAKEISNGLGYFG